MLDFTLVLFQERVFRVLVHLRLVLDLLRSVSVPESGHGLLEVVVSGREGRDHDSFRVASQTVLQQAGQIRVSIRGMLRFTIAECRDHISERHERLVNKDAFFERLSSRASL